MDKYQFLSFRSSIAMIDSAKMIRFEMGGLMIIGIVIYCNILQLISKTKNEKSCRIIVSKRQKYRFHDAF